MAASLASCGAVNNPSSADRVDGTRSAHKASGSENRKPRLLLNPDLLLSVPDVDGDFGAQDGIGPGAWVGRGLGGGGFGIFGGGYVARMLAGIRVGLPVRRPGTAEGRPRGCPQALAHLDVLQLLHAGEDDEGGDERQP